MEGKIKVSSGAVAAMQELSYGGARDPRMKINSRPLIPTHMADRAVQLWRKQ
jgi:hypothetical protein